jgi:hypothetical protein
MSVPLNPPSRVGLLVFDAKDPLDQSAWNLAFDWVHHGGAEPAPAHAARLAEAAFLNPEVALIDSWKRDVIASYGRVPSWAAELDEIIPRYGHEPCGARWLEYLQQLLLLIGAERAPSSACRKIGECGQVTEARLTWARTQLTDLNLYLQGGFNPASELHALIGTPTPEKIAAATLLVEGLRLALEKPLQQFEASFAAVRPHGELATYLRPAVAHLQFRCGYRWEQNLRDICQSIGDPGFRTSPRRFWHFGKCGRQLALVRKDDPARLDASGSALLGLWSWLMDIPSVTLAQTWPTLAPAARRARYTLGEETPAKRWIAARTFIALRLALQDVDRSLPNGYTVMNAYPRLIEWGHSVGGGC